MAKWALGAGAAAALLVLSTHTALAASGQTYVSGAGTDAGANTCPITNPCATLTYALTQTNDGGTINVIGPGAFGSLIIGKSVSIIAQGGPARTLAIAITGGAVVILRGLVIDPGTANSNAIQVLSAPTALHVENCLIIRRKAQAKAGILFQPSDAAELYVSDSIISDHGASNGGVGLSISSSGANAVIKAHLDRVRIHNNRVGLATSTFSNGGGIVAAVRDSTIVGNAFGITAANNSGSGVDLTIDRSTIADNTTGVRASIAGTTVRIGGSLITANATALDLVSPAAIQLLANTRMVGNGSDSADILRKRRRGGQ
jgi:hypothetical protein